MELDFDQLPVPAWDLKCPSCGYTLDGLPGHRCPECGSGFRVAELVQTWTRVRPPKFTGHELPIPEFGPDCACRGCGYPTVGWSTPRCPECGVDFDPEAHRPRGAWFAVDQARCGALLLPVVEMLIGGHRIPHFTAENRSMVAVYMGGSAYEARLVVASEFYFEFLHLIAEESARMRRDAADAAADWTCPACRESVPANFDVCWSCEAERPAATLGS